MISAEDIKKLSPMMQKYFETKEEYKDCILFYRLGDFYEMFFDDAEIVSKELELTLTGKNCGLDERAPMCGIPYHAVDSYLPKLVSRGFKVAICEQVEDPKLVKGLVKREVIRIVTPGTNTNIQSLDSEKNNYCFGVFYSDNKIGAAIADVLTGDFYMTEIEDLPKLRDEIAKFEPSEITCNEAFLLSGDFISEIKERFHVPVTTLDGHFYDDNFCNEILKKHFHAASLTALGIEDFSYGKLAAGSLLKYLYDTQKTELSHITHITPYISGKFMLIDSSTRRNLELTETLREKQKRGSLLWVLDKTKTAMGGRLLRHTVEQPLIDIAEMNLRLDAIEDLNKNSISRDEIREYLNPVYDLERLLGKVAIGSANPRDLLAFKSSLLMLPPIKIALKDLDDELINRIDNDIDPLEDITGLIERSISEEAPLSLYDGSIIKDGFDDEIDRLKNAKNEGKNWLAEYEEEERQKTGIKNLRIKYNRAFGYYFEVTNSFKDQVPDYFIRRQTLTNAERYTTDRLHELEDEILNSEEKLLRLEHDVFCSIRDAVSSEIERIQKSAKAIGWLDMLSCLAYVSEKNRYVRPKLNDKGIINIKNGRHPVVEQMLKGGLFVENDTYLDTKNNCISIITGPNMAGKSTYMRQSALIVLMAQIGCYVPASSADIGIVDRIFTRVGASDDLASGQSTFMVEMNEVSNILRNATPKSLLILDEIGRGTSTFDGLSIAWAVIEHISNTNILGARTLFATHYHELTELEGKINNVNNYCIAVRESGDDIVFLRKIVKGGADRSYGIQVARLAGVPDMVIDRAKEIAEQLSDNDITEKIQSISVNAGGENGKSKRVERPDDVDLGQMSFFETVSDEDVLKELAEIDISTLTPLDALNTLYKLQNKINNRYSF